MLLLQRLKVFQEVMTKVKNNGSRHIFNHVPKRNDDRAHIQREHEFVPSLKTHSHEGN